MQHTFRCGFAGQLALILAVAVTGCGDDDQSPSTPTSPSSPAVAGAQGVSLASLSLSESAVYGQQGVMGSVTLTGSAPAGGAVVALSSSHIAARVGQNVMVAGGGTTATFAIDTSSVGATTPVTINASYGGVTRSAFLTVRPPQITAAFTVTSPTKGAGACVLGPTTDQADCVLDARGSTGPIERWVWRYWTGNNPVGHATTDAMSRVQFSSRCLIFDGGRGGDGSSGDRYVHMQIELVVQDREGNRTDPVVQPVRLYPNRLCGFTY